LLHNGVSGWYARLDRTEEDRLIQIETWLKAWSSSLIKRMPVAALLPVEWPTLPANLLTDPGHVLDHLLARLDAEKDGRSPRGAHPTPPKLADAIIRSELLTPAINNPRIPEKPSLPLDALPPGFRQHIEQMNLSSHPSEDKLSIDEKALSEVESGNRTLSGIPLPLADSACGGGIFMARLLKFHAEILDGEELELIAEDTRRLLSGVQLADVNPDIARVARSRIHLETVRLGLANIGDGNNTLLSQVEVECLLADSVKVCDSLQDSWPWERLPRLMITNPPWLRIKDKFRGHENGSELRKELGGRLRGLTEEDGSLRFCTMKGNVNLYRLFIERGLQILQPEGTLRIIAPDSLLREQSSAPLRNLLAMKHGWQEVWAIEEANLFFPGIAQGVSILSVTANGKSRELLIRGPVERSDLRRDGTGLSARVPSFILGRESWEEWTKGTWAVPRLPRDSLERKDVLKVISKLAKHPRLGEGNHWLVRGGENVRVRVGEVDQTSHAKDIGTWVKGRKSRPFIRGVHFSEDDSGVVIRHPAYDSTIPSRSTESHLSMWAGSTNYSYGPRVACQAIVNANQERRLRWAVIKDGCVLGNSVNHIELSSASEEFLAISRGSLLKGLQWLCSLLNDEDIDIWARVWAANNNVNNYELEMLPIINPEQNIGAIIVK